jgi:ATP adenylyltransferase
VSLYYLPNARGADQRQRMVDLEKAGICIFCPQHLGKELLGEVSNEVIFRLGGWALVKNKYPYPGALHHFMLVPREHVGSALDLSGKAKIEYWDALERTVQEYGLTYWGEGSRNGEPAHTGATIRHYHVQLVVADPDYEGEPVRLYLGSSPKNEPST